MVALRRMAYATCRYRVGAPLWPRENAVRRDNRPVVMMAASAGSRSNLPSSDNLFLVPGLAMVAAANSAP